MSFKVDENNCANAGLKAYDGEERRSWQREADMLRSRLETIEGIAMDTKDLAGRHTIRLLPTWPRSARPRRPSMS